ncbi:LysE family transporter [Streptomyces sp. TLI_171]|uniref:LysE family transporter n=1 Tax=Streptomyces sp. TLI_171 TaxID=1938859 RepID=UPI000C196B75|nr:LysE family transporter [Streptomyces sp. TLI_171]
MTGAAVEGVVAGLGVAVPLGAVGVLLLQEGRRGWAPAAGGATAVAAVDGAYAAVAVLAGPQVAALLSGHESAVRAVSALLLGAIAVHGLLGLRRSVETAEGPSARGAGRSFVRFALLTAVNPTTALYFTALIAARGTTAHAGATAFVTGVFLASLAWQHLLAAAGAFAGARLGPRLRRATYAAGYGLVALLAVRLALAG